ncbi:hypothetical protein EV356DRAFT_442042 [Viridothelium virens]|uniref:Uncharacterized protein n=1 Tax=Viridothelium virens TaxID=1048519 RepID=A0A6A6HH99_VIRVR|nr:hypothetical protein EV356DRAFT_442042 [Viridothelium virens]
MAPAEVLDVPAPPHRPSSAIGKRKRSDSDSPLQPNGVLPATATESVDAIDMPRFHTLLKDLLYILKIHDTSPSILALPLPSNVSHLSESEPSSKRTKVSKTTRSPTIAARIEAEEYISLHEVREDVEAACSEVLAIGKINGDSMGSLSRQFATPPEGGSLYAGVLSFRKLFNTLIDAESHRLYPSVAKSKKIKSEEDGEPPLNLTETTLDDGQSGKTVLTLYGNAQGPKQLFSSLQQPVHAKRDSDSHEDRILNTDSLRVTAPLREHALPNHITASKIISVQADDAANEKGRIPTIGELFAPSSAVPQLNPPKPPKQSTARGSRIGWVDSNSLPKTGKKGTYTTQNLTTGHWLGYNNLNIPQEPTSPTAKRKQRDRALSTGEARPAPSEEATAALRQAKEDALFRTAYSSFAPTRDDSMAIVPEETKNRVWWQRHGEKRFVETFAIDPALEDETMVKAEADEARAAEDKSIQEAVDAYVPEEMEGLIKTEEANEQEKKEVEDILKEISELLETLHSYQRIRNSNLPANTRAPAANQKPSLPWLAESPTTPSAAEFDTYSILKDQLKLLIRLLPPSAVAKLNGDQLEDLNIKQTINIENQNNKGVMEEHQATRYAKAAALNVAMGPTRSSSHLGQVQYSSSSQYGRTPLQQSSSRPAQANQGYYPQQQPPNRSPSMNFSQRPSSGNSQNYTTPTQASSNRTSYTASYSQSRPAQQSYGGIPNGQGFHQRPSSGNYNYSQQYNTATPIARPQNGVGYPPRPSGTVPTSYSTPTSGTYARTSSPHNKTATAFSTGSRQSYPASYGGSSTALPAKGRRNSPSTPNPTSAPAQAHSATGPSGYHTYQTSQEQQLMLDRQKAQLAMQPQARASAQAGTLKGEASEQQDTKTNGVTT